MAVVWVPGVAALDVGSREAKKASWLVSGPGPSLSTRFVPHSGICACGKSWGGMLGSWLRESTNSQVNKWQVTFLFRKAISFL